MAMSTDECAEPKKRVRMLSSLLAFSKRRRRPAADGAKAAWPSGKGRRSGRC